MALGLGLSNSVSGTNRRGWRRCSWGVYTFAWLKDERQHKLKQEELRLEIRRSLFPRSGAVAHGGWAISILRRFKPLTL